MSRPGRGARAGWRLFLAVGSGLAEPPGHAELGITLDIYSHVLPTMGLAAASKLDSVLATTALKKRRAAAEA